MGLNRFRKSEHLRVPSEFKRVYDRRCSVRAELLTVCGCPNDRNHTRVGLSVSRKVGNAVARNRMKRLYREAFRLVRPQLPLGLDLVLVPRSSREPDLQYLKETLITLTSELARRLATGNK